MTRRAAAVALALAAVPGAAAEPAYPFRAGPGSRRVADIELPPGFTRVKTAPGSFADYVRHAPLMPPDTPVVRHDGVQVLRATQVVAVLDMPLLNQNQQCADSALRYWFEFLREDGRQEEIAARLTSGEWVRLSEWRKKRRAGESDDALYRRFLAHCMAYVGSFSMNRDLQEIEEGDLGPGDLIVQPNPKGGIGHLSLVLDVATDTQGRRALLVGYGFLPAQSVYLPRPDAGNGVKADSEWFTLPGFQEQHAYLGKTFTYRRFGAPRP